MFLSRAKGEGRGEGKGTVPIANADDRPTGARKQDAGFSERCVVSILVTWLM